MKNTDNQNIQIGLTIVMFFAIVGTVTLAISFAGRRNIAFDVIDESTLREIEDDTAFGGTYVGFSEEEAFSVVCTNPIQISPPANDFASKVASSAEGSCFFFANGIYKIHDVSPKDNMIFEGESVEGVVLDGSGYDNAFYGNSKEVTIRRMQFHNFDKLTKLPQEQGPIRGQRTVLGDALQDYAQDWLIEEVWSHHGAGSGIILGDGFTVRNSKFHSNGITGIAADRVSGALIENNEVYGNGRSAANGDTSNGAGMKFTWLRDENTDFIVRNNRVHDNTDRGGIWCDLDCNDFIVENNEVYGHVWFGIFIELSRDTIIRGNTVTNSNGGQKWTGDFANGCIATGESTNVLIENNIVIDCDVAIMLRETKRPSSSEQGYLGPYVANGVLKNTSGSNITFRNNVIKNSKSVGLAVGPTGVGRTDKSTIKFEGNTYDNPGSMDFWWDRQKQSYSQWQAAGRQ